MKMELFGISPVGHWDYLGSYGKMNQLLDAVDEYTGMGYRDVKFCSWNRQ